jgi:transketolase
LERVGVDDRFGESAQAEEMLEMMGLTASDVADAAKRAISRK